MISSLASKCQLFKHGGFQFHYIKWLKNGHSNFKVLAFWSQWRYHDQIQITRSHIIRIKYWNAGGSGFPPSLNPTLWSISILHYKQAKLRKHLQHSVFVIQYSYRYLCNEIEIASFCQYKISSLVSHLLSWKLAFAKCCLTSFWWRFFFPLVLEIGVNTVGLWGFLIFPWYFKLLINTLDNLFL